MSTLRINTASEDERPTLENLLQLYTHDFSEHWAGTDRGDVDAEGRFAPYPLEAYWREPGRTPFLIREGARIVGFALVNDVSNSGEPIDHNVAEFFVLRKFRRSGVGAVAAHLLFERYPGVWEAAVARRNVAALAFWRRAISTCPTARDLTERDVTSDSWNGPILRFRSV